MDGNDWTVPTTRSHRLHPSAAPTRRLSEGEDESAESYAQRYSDWIDGLDFVTSSAYHNWTLVLSRQTGLIHGYRTAAVQLLEVPEVDLPDECAGGVARLRDPHDYDTRCPDAY